MVPLFSAVLDNCSSLICRPNTFCVREDSKLILLVFLARLGWYVCFYPIFKFVFLLNDDCHIPFSTILNVQTTNNGWWWLEHSSCGFSKYHRQSSRSVMRFQFLGTTIRTVDRVLFWEPCGVCDSRNKGTKPSSWSSSSCHKNWTRLNLPAIYTRTLRKPIQSENARLAQFCETSVGWRQEATGTSCA